MRKQVAYLNQEQIQTANRIDKNFDIFLNATEEELNTLENNPHAYQTIVQNAAMLHQLANYDTQKLQEMTGQLQELSRKQALQKALHTAPMAY